MQPEFDDPRYGGINPYALGFAMMQDIERICLDPTEEDRYWCPDIAGCGDPLGALKDIWANYRDESFVSQYLSPRLIRQWKMFQIRNEEQPRTSASTPSTTSAATGRSAAFCRDSTMWPGQTRTFRWWTSTLRATGG